MFIMATRSFILKIEPNEEVKKGLWKTHEVLNHGIAYYMNILKLIRQEAIYEHHEQDPKNPKKVSKAEIQAELWDFVLKMQKRNSFTLEVDKDEVFNILRELYEELVPSSVDKKGEANQLSNKFLYPLVDPNSQSGKGTASSGRKPRWYNLKMAGDPSWQEERKKWEEDKKKDPLAKILGKLAEYGLIPLFIPFTDSNEPIVKEIKWMEKSRNQSVRRLDKDMFIQALERFLSWESWNLKVKEEYEKVEKEYKTLEERIKEDIQALKALEQYEKERQEQLLRDTLNANEYRLSKRGLRGWREIIQKWLKMDENEPSEKYLEVFKDYQRKHPREAGDYSVYEFLSKKENHFIWRNHPEYPYLYATFCEIDKKKKDAKQQATFTLADPINHPLWVRFEERSGSNLNKYRILTEQLHTEKLKKKLTVQLDRLIYPTESGGWEEKGKVDIVLLPSRQFYNQIFLDIEEKGKHAFTYKDESIKFPLKGTLGGARVQFDRDHLRRYPHKVESGNVGRIYFNMTVNIEPTESPVSKSLKIHRDDFPKVVNFKPKELTEWIKDSKGKKLKSGIESLEIGLRVMSIDLGQRQAAAASIFEVVDQKPDIEGKLFFPIKGTELYAVHRASFNIKLPGETLVKSREVLRKAREDNLKLMNQKLNFLRNVLHFQQFEDITEREKRVTKWISRQENSDVPLVYQDELIQIRELMYKPYKDWVAFLKQLHKRLEVEIGKEVKHWRKSLSDGRKGLYGISLKNIDEIDRTRKFLLRWSLRPTEPGEVRRLEPGQRFAIDQLNHLNALKEDRLKKMANTIIMHALGYCYDVRKKKWQAKNPACQIILFEDLSNYNPYEERSRFENSKLMKWSRREIPRQVALQGEIYGLQVGEVGAQFSSRFHAKTGSPGIRCSVVTKEKLQDNRFFKNLQREGRLTLDKIAVLKEGDLYPDKGGEKFISLSKDRKLVTTHADINAAQNLQKRFWTRTHGFYKVYCKAYQVDGQTVYIPESKDQKQKIIEEFGEGYFILKDGVYEWGNAGKLKIKKGSSKQSSSELVDSDILKDSFDLASELKGEKLMLYRDPSGNVFPSDKWMAAGVFFGKLERILISKLTNQYSISTIEDDSSKQSM